MSGMYASQYHLLLWPAEARMVIEVSQQLAAYGFTLDTPATLTELLVRLRGGAHALLVDWQHAHRLVAEDREALTQAIGATPLVCLSQDGGLASRLAAVRFGCQGYIAMPADSAQLPDTLDRLLARDAGEAGRVLIIEDSPSSAAFYSRALQQAGLKTRVITNPLKVLESLQELPPELILMDMYMPGASGEELARVIRQQDAYLGIPIVYLSAESDPVRQRQAMAQGGDEFLEKTIPPELLVSAVKTRIARYRRLQRLIVRDSLTGLLNHSHFKERLRVEQARCRRSNKPLALVLLDIDHFKQVNDTHGHPTGDRVLRSLARLLRQRLRGTDVIGRYGGEEFAIALPDTLPEQAVALLNNLRELFANMPQSSRETVFHCAFSAGVAACSPDQDSESLLHWADQALYKAKQGGRNRVVLHE
jgi:diguanylate cyclase (GGDEF)-like protein